MDEQPKERQGFHDISVTESYLPFYSNCWPHEHMFVHQLRHFLDTFVNQKNVAPYGATFEDGCRAAWVGDVILESAAARGRVDAKD